MKLLFASGVATTVCLLLLAGEVTATLSSPSSSSSTSELTHNNSGRWRYPSIVNATSISFDDANSLYLHGTLVAETWVDLTVGNAMGQDALARMELSPGKVDGWQMARVTSFDTIDPYYTAGFLEGFATFEAMYDVWYVQVRQNDEQIRQMPGAYEFMMDHIEFQRRHDRSSAFGNQLHNQMRQVDGLFDGWLKAYAENTPANMTQLDYLSVFLISYMNEAENVIDKFSASAARRSENSADPLVRNNLHCSGLVKLTDDDLFFAHDTWGAFNMMNRQLKTYVFAEATIVMSSYAGSISSIDDWYMTSLGLGVMETTNGIFNNSLLASVRSDQVSDFNRAMIANYLATTPAEWITYFITENSGTYNNQWMVADMTVARKTLANKTSGGILPPGTFYVAEQIPGLVVYADQTAHLNTERYWGSYNIPFYPQIYNLSGFAARDTPEYWGLNNHHEYARAVIFKRMQGEVVDHASMYYLMRYNNYLEDQASTVPWCKTAWTPKGVVDCGSTTQAADLAIAGRYDLNPSTIPNPPGNKESIGPFMFGAIDTKVTSAAWMADNVLKAVAICGPTRVQQPVFDHAGWIADHPGNWQDKVTWRGVPNRLDFDPVIFSQNTTA